MVSRAQARHIRISARKARLVFPLIKGKSTQSALAILGQTRKRAAQVVNKLVRSAVANAKQKGLTEEGLFIAKVYADEGATWKRFRAQPFGRASRINKRTCHITVELDQNIRAPKPAETPKAKPAAAKKSVARKKASA